MLREEMGSPKPDAGESDHITLPPVPRVPRRTLLIVGAVLGAGVVVLLAVGFIPRVVKARQLREEARALATRLPRVKVVKPRFGEGTGSVTLPGSIEPLRDTWVYARANGYVRRWLVDIGAQVEEGQTLLELDTPELDSELNQARATLAQASTAVDQAKANRMLAAVTAKRYEQLGPPGVASQQEVEEKRTQLAVAEANVKAAEAAVESQRANLNRLLSLKSFAKVVAPFAGRVTARNVEKGQLVSAGGAGGQGLFRIAAVDTVRVFVHVPQDLAPSIQLGQRVSVSLRDMPERSFAGKVSHTAGALDSASRSLTTEVQIPNADQQLMAGTYAQVTIQLARSARTLRVPSLALVADSRGTRLMTVDASNRLQSIPVQVGRDLGAEIEVTSGLTGTERVVTSFPPGTPDGTMVEIVGSEGGSAAGRESGSSGRREESAE